MTEPSRLSERARSAIEASDNEVLLSVISIWEMTIKAAIGRLSLVGVADLRTFVATQLRETGFSVLAVRLEHALQVGSLPQFHRDPFDRMLIAQAQVESLQIVTRDAQMGQYGVEAVW